MSTYQLPFNPIPKSPRSRGDITLNVRLQKMLTTHRSHSRPQHVCQRLNMVWPIPPDDIRPIPHSGLDQITRMVETPTIAATFQPRHQPIDRCVPERIADAGSIYAARVGGMAERRTSHRCRLAIIECFTFHFRFGCCQRQDIERSAKYQKKDT